MTSTIRTQVAIVGGGPAGLMLSHLLSLDGVESVVLEKRSREYVEKRVRAGVLEQGTVDLLRSTGLGTRLDREGLRHEGIELRFEGESHRLDLAELTGGRCITIYGQQEVVKDLIEARQAAGGAVHFNVDDVRITVRDNPRVACTLEGIRTEIRSDFLAGCDGFHGISRSALPPNGRRVYEREYPFGWVGILVAVAPSCFGVTYAGHERGLGLHSMRSPELTRLYVQCGRDDTIEEWPDSRIWDELHTRLAVPGWTLQEGPILEKGITGLRSFVVEPMQHGRMYLAGDAGHIVPPTGAKGLNLALADVRVLSQAMVGWYRSGSSRDLDSYSATCLKRVWRAQEFSSWMTQTLHRLPDDHDGFERRLQLARLRRLTQSRAAATALAEMYVG